MAVDLDPTFQDDDVEGIVEEEEEEERVLMSEEDAPAHHPFAPPDELFDISTTVDPSYIISLIRKLIPPEHSDFSEVGGVAKSIGSGISNMDSTEERVSPDSRAECLPRDNSSVMDTGNRNKEHGAIAREEAWEEYGCILWDIAAGRTHAELMVQNLVLDVLVATLMVTQSVRVREICLGIIGNLACHEVLMDNIVSTSGLIQTVVDQLFLDDTQCLCEAYRLLTLCLQGKICITWAEALLPDHVLQRLVWIAENTLNSLLLEKSVGLLLAILESEQGAAPILLPPLIKIGLPNLLISLLAYEISKLTDEQMPERYPVLDVILRAIEALSSMDGYSEVILANKDLLQLVSNLIKLPDKTEIAESCVTTVVLIANILADVTNLASEMSQDLPFLQGLFDILPFTSNDMVARNALWSIIAQLLVQIKENEMERPTLNQYASILASKSDLIEEDLLDQRGIISDEHDSPSDSKSKTNATVAALKRITNILNHWTGSKDSNEEKAASEEQLGIDAAVSRLLEFCHKYIK